MAPSGGLKFTDDTAVIPFDPQAIANDSQPSRTVDWTATDPSNLGGPLNQNLVDGWLYSRTPTQFITARVEKSAKRLEIHPTAAGQPPRVVNQLGTAIKQLLLVDENDKCFTAADVATDANAPMQSAESQADAFQKIQPLVDANRSQPMINPANREIPSFFGFVGSGHIRSDSASTAVRWRHMLRPQNPGGIMPLNPGTLERSLSDTWQQLTDNSLPPRTYVAVVELSPEVQFGTSAAKPEESLHVIVGQW